MSQQKHPVPLTSDQVLVDQGSNHFSGLNMVMWKQGTLLHGIVRPTQPWMHRWVQIWLLLTIHCKSIAKHTHEHYDKSKQLSLLISKHTEDITICWQWPTRVFHDSPFVLLRLLLKKLCPTSPHREGQRSTLAAAQNCRLSVSCPTTQEDSVQMYLHL